MTVDDPGAHLKDPRPAIRSRLPGGTYDPPQWLRMELPKASGRIRALGVPTLLDRFIQEAVSQVLQTS